MPDWDKFWASIDLTEMSSILIAVVAAVISVISVVLTKKSVRAAERSAEAAEASSDAALRQADASERQAEQASVQSDIVSQQLEIETLAAARLRVDEAAPDVSIAVLSVDDLRAVHIFCKDEVPHWTPQPVTESQTLNMWEHNTCKLQLTLNGIVYNNSSLAIRANCHAAYFQPGRHPTTDEELPVPYPTEPGSRGYVLYPNQSALFKTIIERDIDWWIERDEKDNVGATEPGAVPGTVFAFLPSTLNEPWTVWKLNVVARPVQSTFQRDGEKYAELTPYAFIYLSDAFERPYPESVKLLHAQLTGDERKIYNIMMMQEFMRKYKD